MLQALNFAIGQLIHQYSGTTSVAFQARLRHILLTKDLVTWHSTWKDHALPTLSHLVQSPYTSRQECWIEPMVWLPPHASSASRLNRDSSLQTTRLQSEVDKNPIDTAYELGSEVGVLMAPYTLASLQEWLLLIPPDVCKEHSLLKVQMSLEKSSSHIHHIWHYRVRLRESGQPIGRLRKTCKNAFPRTIPVSFGRLDTPIATESSLNVHFFKISTLIVIHGIYKYLRQ
ncbi:hypothetical protein TNCV_1646681 [Trichonephila clavipes]|nr:hypothetical protein TNCV_1646681 [Trichonephila clavipes]